MEEYSRTCSNLGALIQQSAEAGTTEGDVQRSNPEVPSAAPNLHAGHHHARFGNVNTSHVRAADLEVTRTELMACAEAHLKEAEHALTEAKKLQDLMAWEAVPSKLFRCVMWI